MSEILIEEFPMIHLSNLSPVVNYSSGDIRRKEHLCFEFMMNESKVTFRLFIYHFGINI